MIAPKYDVAPRTVDHLVAKLEGPKADQEVDLGDANGFASPKQTRDPEERRNQAKRARDKSAERRIAAGAKPPQVRRYGEEKVLADRHPPRGDGPDGR